MAHYKKQVGVTNNMMVLLYNIYAIPLFSYVEQFLVCPHAAVKCVDSSLLRLSVVKVWEKLAL